MIENKKVDELKEINNTYNKKIQELEKKLKENQEYFNDYEINRIETQEKNKKLDRSIYELNKEKQEIKQELNDKKTSLDEYKNELGILDLRPRQKYKK